MPKLSEPWQEKIETERYTLYLGDCLDVLPMLEVESVEAIIADPPYGVTPSNWDQIIPVNPLWKQLKRVITQQGAVVLFGAEPFSSLLQVGNLEQFKYRWVWIKGRPGDVFNAKNKPMRNHEDILVFSPGTTANGSDRRMTYNPQGLAYQPVRTKNHYRKDGEGAFKRVRPSHPEYVISEYTNYPTSILEVPTGESPFHPTQKPVDLLNYLGSTYTNLDETILDFTMGSGTTGVACMNLGRKFIGIEIDPTYFAIAAKRISEARLETPAERALASLPRDGTAGDLKRLVAKRRSKR